MIPPTVAAAMMTTSGRCAFIQSSTGCWRRRSTSGRPMVKLSQPSRARRRTRALPTMPPWPATKTRRPTSAKGSALAVFALMLLAHRHQVGRHHLGHQFAETGLVAPAELGARLRRIAQQEIDLRRAEISGIDGNQHIAALGIHALLLGAGAAPGDLAADEGLAPRRALMVEQDPVRGVDAIGLAVIDRDPIAVELGRRIGAARHEGRRLALGGGRAVV